MKKTKLWSKDFLTVSLINFLIYLVYYLLMIIIAEFAMDSLDATPGQAGSAVGIFILGALIARIVTGSIIEKIGYKKMLFIGLGIYFISSFFYYIAGNLSLLLLVRLIHGIGFGSVSVVTSTVVVQLIPFECRGEGIGYYSLSTTLASAIGPMLGMFLVRQLSFQTIITLSIFLLVLGMIGVLLGIGYSSIVSFLTSYTKEIDLITAGSFFFIVYSIAILFSRPLAGRLMDDKGENFVMYPTFISFILDCF
ncbi:MFS transporter [Enterococcus olivae]